MFWNKGEKARISNRYRADLTDAISRLEEMDISCLHKAYCAVASGDPVMTARGGRAVRWVMETLTMQQMIRLSENFRQYTSMEWTIDWKGIDLKRIKSWFESQQDYIYILILGSFHPNGYYREACIREMEDMPGVLPYLILRLNDWVEQVRICAVRMVKSRLADCPLDELFTALMALEKVKCSGRRNDSDLGHIESTLEKRLEQEAADITPEFILRSEYAVRSSIYRFLFGGARLKLHTAETLLKEERHSFCQTLIISGLLAHYDCSMEMTDRYMTFRSSSVRRKALEYKYGILKNAWPGLESMLLDTCHGIRDMAAYILRKHSDLDILAFYREHLRDTSPAAAIRGIGEQGNGRMAELVLPFLNCSSEKVVRITIEALGRLTGQEGEPIYWRYLFDPRVSVSRASYLCMKKYRIHCGAGLLYEELGRQKVKEEDADHTVREGISKAHLSHIRRYLVRLLIQEGSWERLPYLIYLYCDPSMEELKDKILGAMWIRSLYTRISRQDAGVIEQALETAGDTLPEKLIKDIRFDLKFIV